MLPFKVGMRRKTGVRHEEKIHLNKCCFAFTLRIVHNNCSYHMKHSKAQESQVIERKILSTNEERFSKWRSDSFLFFYSALHLQQRYL
jgi:hypothetical protein